jgi:PAS domain S-box-containing protein
MTGRKNEMGTILIVDDTPANISLLLETLEQEGYDVSVATSGLKALQRITRIHPDLILLDILMPEMDGFETCRQIKAQETSRDIPIIFLSALNDSFDKVQGFTLGAVDYLVKPIAPEELLIRVKTHLSVRRLETELRALNQSLEEHVAVRTAELSHANLLLEEEIAERRRVQEEVIRKNQDISAAHQHLVVIEEELRKNYEKLVLRERQLRESEANFREVLENSLVALYKCDYTKKKYEYFSPAISIITGFSHEEIMNVQHGGIFEMVHPGDRNILQERMGEVIAGGGGVLYVEYRLFHKNGLVRWVGELVHFVVDTKGSPLYSIGTIQDITDRKMAEEGLTRATNKLKILNSITFNDIQNYVYILTGYLELEKERSSDPHVLQYLELQKDIIQKITNSLEFTENYQHLGLKPPRWHNVRETFLYGISHTDLSQLTRTLDIDNLEIYADPLLENVFFALSENVLLHAKTATHIALRYQETNEGLTLIFEDNGRGILEDVKENIFERKTGAKKGMDLFLVREIIGITGITIIETGKPGKGARFQMMVPKGAYRFVTNQ